MKIRVNDLALDTLGYLLVVQYFCWVSGSEFPERECCDTIFSSPPNPEPIQPTRPAITRNIFFSPNFEYFTNFSALSSICHALKLLPISFSDMIELNSFQITARPHQIIQVIYMFLISFNASVLCRWRQIAEMCSYDVSRFYFLKLWLNQIGHCFRSNTV